MNEFFHVRFSYALHKKLQRNAIDFESFQFFLCHFIRLHFFDINSLHDYPPILIVTKSVDDSSFVSKFSSSIGS